MLSLIAPLALTAASVAAPDDCTGDPGFVLTIDPPVAQVGEPVHIRMEGPANQPAFLMVSTGEGPVETSYGKVCLDFPLLFSRFVFLDDQGLCEFRIQIPDNCNLDDLSVFMQFIVCDPFKATSNQTSLHIETPKLGDLRFAKYIDRDLRGLRAREVLEIAELVISGAFGQCDDGRCRDDDVFDVDGDGDPDVSIDDLHEALCLLNNAFDDCRNRCPELFENAGCESYCTWDYCDYARCCKNGNIGCLRDEWFDVLFPEGLLIGDPDGADEDFEHSLLLTSSQAMRKLLERIGRSRPATLDEDEVDPRSTSGGRFAAQILAAKFNIALSDAGVTGS